MAVVIVRSLAAIPLGVLIGPLRDPTLGRRSRFWWRFAGLVIWMVLPWMVGLVGSVGEQAAVTLLLLGIAWALLLVALAPLLLFRHRGSDPGPSDDSGGGPGPEDDRQPPHRPIGGSRCRTPSGPRRACADPTRLDMHCIRGVPHASAGHLGLWPLWPGRRDLGFAGSIL